jgi:glycosyltransferase involved in cell wall biosynthesis
MRYKSSNKIHLVWIYAGDLSKAMDAATWLKTVEELCNLGWEVTLIAAGPNGYRQIRGVNVLCVRRPEIFLLRQIAFHLGVLYIILRQFAGIDAILFHELSAPWILPLRFFRWLSDKRRPLLVMDTRSVPMPPPEKETWKDKARRVAYAIANHLGNRYADGRLAITQRMADVLCIPGNKLWGIWPSGADVEYFSVSRRNRCWPTYNDPIHLIYHGTMDYERNLMVLSRAVERANSEEMLFVLSLVGDGRERADLENFAAQSNGAVRVIPSIPHAEIPNILTLAHVGVLPFPDEEKFRVSSPIKLFEYMAAGMPILATCIPCHTNVVGRENYVFWAIDATEQGLLDAIRLVWQARASLGTMGQCAKSAAKNWTWKSAAEKLKKALETGLEKNP